MARKPILYPALAGWEIVRLLVLIVLLAYASLGALFPRGEIVALSLLLGGGNLIVPFGALYLYFSGVPSRPLRLTLVAAKVLGLFTGALACAAVFIQFIGMIAADAQSSSPKSFFEGSVLAFIFLIDLIFLSLLLSLKEEAAPDVSSRT